MTQKLVIMSKQEEFRIFMKKSLGENYCILLFLLLLGLISRLSWIAYTDFTDEDALITFRIAKNLAEGIGFVYNNGERLLGTTSPMFALILGGWMALVSNDVILGARAINVITSISSLVFLTLALRKIEASIYHQIAIILIFALSAKLLLLEMGGMETSLVIFLMIASWYLYIARRMIWTGIILGLLLFTRIDLFIWPLSILLFELTSSPKNAIRMGITIFFVNVPWIVFSFAFFGSPIPHTVLAKWAAYIQNVNSPYYEHLLAVANFMSPFSQYKDHIALRNILAWTTLLIVAWQAVKRFKGKYLALIAVFAFLEISRLVLTRTTFFNRYFAPLLVGIWILFGMGLGDLWEAAKVSPHRTKQMVGFALITLLGIGLVFGGYEADQARMKQDYRHYRSLKNIGIWLNENSQPSDTVLLEPLGYIGFYSDRYMIDEVGLVSPEVVTMKKQGMNPNTYFSILSPDYYVIHCDDAMRLQGLLGDRDWGLSDHYTRVVTYNPLDYDMQLPDYSAYGALQRNSCYDVWQRD